MESNVLDVKNRMQFREWLLQNVSNKSECWVELKRGRPADENVFYYIDAVEEALCFGWIDSVVHPINGIQMQRFSPRKKNSP